MVVAGPERREQDAGKEDDVCQLQAGQTGGMAVAENVQYAPQPDDQERQIGHDIAEVVDAEQRAAVGKLVVRRVLCDRCSQEENGANCRDREDNNCDGATRKAQMPIFASRSANSRAMRSATGWSAAKRDSRCFARSTAVA